MEKSKIIIVDDNPSIPPLLKEIIEMEPDMTVACEAANKDEFFACLAKNKLDVALVDLSLKEREGGLDILGDLRRRNKPLPVIIVSAYDEYLYGLRSLTLGASGFISKNFLVSELIPGIRCVLEGKPYVSGPKGETIVQMWKEDQKKVRSGLST